jgi:cupin 2 domain-containing protein
VTQNFDKPSAHLRHSIRSGVLTNIFENLPARSEDEEFTDLFSRKGVRIERIVSNGQSTPTDAPYDQGHDEWVLLLRGSASLWVDGDGERDLRPGDHVLIPAHRLHRVTRTAENERTVWLAIHFC